MIVPTLILPRDDELETLGRTVEQTLGRSVKSIDVIGRGKYKLWVSILLIATDAAFFLLVDPLSRASLSRDCV